uniref:Transmembrane protein n=1 Tax=Myotis myotis TaxID=51298 RepID=A0A7J7RSH6_MYOMY|nr:hypothetical protein mMyoMyo1_010195 [Myotis myotis]
MSCFAWLLRACRLGCGLPALGSASALLPSPASTGAARLPAGQTPGTRTIVYFGICLIACMAVCFLFSVSLLGGFFPISVFVLFAFLARWLSLFLKVPNTKIRTKKNCVSAAVRLQRRHWKICHANFIVNFKMHLTALKDFHFHGPFEPLWLKSNRPF